MTLTRRSFMLKLFSLPLVLMLPLPALAYSETIGGWFRDEAGNVYFDRLPANGDFDAFTASHLHQAMYLFFGTEEQVDQFRDETAGVFGAESWQMYLPVVARG